MKAILSNAAGSNPHSVLLPIGHYFFENDDLLDVREHPNKEKYPYQKLLIIKMNDYVYVVTYVQEQDTMFLKTIIPSRKETKRYLQ